MNRLNKLAVYLSGSIDFAENKGCKWRNEITPFLEDKNVLVFNPLKHIFDGTENIESVKRPHMDKLLENGNYDELRDEIKEIHQ